VSSPERLRPDGRGGPHAFVEDLDSPELSPEDQTHLSRSLRLRTGDPMTICDARGSWRPARFGPTPEPVGETVYVPARRPPVTVAMAPVKGERTRWAVQKLTEVGVDRIVLLNTERGVVRWSGARATRSLDRLAAVARSAAAQSRRVRLPLIEGPMEISDLVATSGEGLAVAERGGGRVSSATHTIAIGPEGGWGDTEIDPDIPRVDLGPGVLRAETAALSAAVLMSFTRHELARGHSE